MRVSREQAARNRARTVDAALRAFRANGFDGVSIADLMASAGLTHGGFYKNFASKEALELEASALGIERSIAAIETAARRRSGSTPSADEPARMPRATEPSTESVVREVAEAYLTGKHRDDPATGCAVAALAVDAGRAGVEVQRVFARGVLGMAEQLASATAPVMADVEGTTAENGQAGAAEPAAIDRALGDIAALVGGIVLARAVKEADPRLSTRILDSTIRHLDPPRSA